LAAVFTLLACNGSGGDVGIAGLIAFTTERDGNLEIYVMNPDGSEERNISRNPARDSSPSWSADGRLIAFVSDRTGNDDVFVMKADGTDVVNLTDHPASDRSPAWSPDGRNIAFVSERDGN